MPILLKLYRSLGHGLKMCILFRYTPHTIFATLSLNELSHFCDRSEKILHVGVLCIKAHISQYRFTVRLK